MPLEVYVAASNELESKKLKLDNREIVPTLGGDEATAVRIGELVGSISSLIGEKLMSDSELTIELTGSTSLKGEGGIKYLLFNIGGSAAKDNSMKVTLKTKVGTKKSR